MLTDIDRVGLSFYLLLPPRLCFCPDLIVGLSVSTIVDEFSWNSWNDRHWHNKELIRFSRLSIWIESWSDWIEYRGYFTLTLRNRLGRSVGACYYYVYSVDGATYIK